ncbi:MAG: tRNA (adenosine(37)-N6)-threonylcarbamoyltransferase complex dimerization subunit type 1 TsaB [Clostridiales bacterium]|nr:tRNA (adenosine(37)-N6)-threonylcarbamoyltransferase complex dimerization subunit type 1 TsaB [Clostridiales bacterium]
MKVLAIDSSSVIAGVAVMDDNQLLYEIYHHNKKNHSEILMSMVEKCLDSCALKLSEIDVYAVSEGPGSFTGLRIGISTVKGLAQATDKPVAAIPTLDAMAWNIVGTNDLICPIMDARRNQVYSCLYRIEGEEYIRLMPYIALSIDELIDRLIVYKQPVRFIGDGIRPYRSILEEFLGEYALFAPPYLAYQRASVIAFLGFEAARAGKTVDYNSLKPFYLRKSQAEQKRNQQLKDNER